MACTMMGGGEQMDMFGAGAGSGKYPETPGARRTDTSQEAADGVAPSAPRLRELVYQEIWSASRSVSEGGLTADEAAARLDLPVLSVRPRVCELNKLGRIRDTGRRRLNASRRHAIVWRAP